MTDRIDRIEGQAMPVNSFLVHGPDGVVVVDAIIRRDDQLKDEVVGPMMGDELPSDSLLFLMDLSIEPTLATLRQAR